MWLSNAILLRLRQLVSCAVGHECLLECFVQVDGQRIVTKRRVDRDFSQWGIELCSFLDQQPLADFPTVRISTKYATEHRCGIVFKGPSLCDRITGTDPLKDKYAAQCI